MPFIARAQAGDKEAFATLFEQYKNLVYKTAYLVLGDRDEAEDALQEVFVLVHRGLAGFDPRKGAFSTWLHRITFNYCLNQHRKQRALVRHALVLPLEDVSSLTSEFQDAQSAEKQAIEQAVCNLSDRQKAVVILRYYWGLSYAEISTILDIPLGTVKSRLDLALKNLRKALGQEPHPSPALEVEMCP